MGGAFERGRSKPVDPGQHDSRDGRRRSKGPPPVDLPDETPVRVDAALEPTCVVAGGVVTLTVVTEPRASVGYEAVYSDGGTGTAAPVGAGYGGNNAGLAGPRGDYSDTWRVSPDAPRGRARVDVFVGYDSEFGYDGVPFRVVSSNAEC